MDVIWDPIYPVTLAADLAAWSVGGIVGAGEKASGLASDALRRAEQAVIWTAVSWSIAAVLVVWLLLKYGPRIVKEVL